jgi:hypothetical protein
MDEKLWAGVELKLLYAEFRCDMMGRSIQPPKQTSINVALQASGAMSRLMLKSAKRASLVENLRSLRGLDKVRVR